MPSPITATWNALSGNWFTAANWDEPNPAAPPPTLHYVPGVNEDAVLGNNSGATPPTPFTVTYNGTSSVNSINGNITGTLDITGGSLTLVNGGAFNSMAINVAGGAGLGVSNGTLNVTAGTYAGTLSGAGTLQFLYGTFNMNAGTSVTVANWVLGVTGNGTVSRTNLNTNLSYGGTFTLGDYSGNGAILNLNNRTLTLSGASTLDGKVTGPGTLLITGSAVAGGTGYGVLGLTGGAKLQFASGATGTQHHDLNVGDNLTAGTLQLDAGSTFTIDASTTLGNTNAANAKIVNNGGIVIGGGAVGATIAGQFTSNGAITINAGNSLSLGFGGTNILNGSVGGAGRLIIGSGLTTVAPSALLSVAKIEMNGGNVGATLKLGKSTTYGGDFSFAGQFDVLQLNGFTLVLSGLNSTLNGNQINGAGTLKVTGAASIGSNASFGTSYGTNTPMTLQNSGAITQTGSISLNGTLLNDAGKTYTITAASNISSVFGGATVTNKGTFKDNAAGVSTITGAFNNVGTLNVSAGATLVLSQGVKTLGGTLSGSGTLVFGGGADATINSGNVIVSAITMAGGGATLRLGADVSYAGTFTLLGQFDVVQLNGHTLTLSGLNNALNANQVNGAGTLKITGKATVGGNISFGTSYGTSTPMTLQNSGTIDQTGSIGLNGTLINDAGRTYTLLAASDILSSGAGATIVNNGTFAATAAGTSTINGALTNSGTLSIGTGSNLVLSQGVKTLGGTIAGNGKLTFGGGTDATINTANVTVLSIGLAGGGSTVRLGTDLTYAGALTFAGQFDTLQLNGHTLTLSGTANSLISNNINGAGTLKITGAATIGGNIGFGYAGGGVGNTAMTLQNAGTITQSGDISLNGTLQNDVTRSYTITAAGNVYSNGGLILNNGSFSDTAAGISEINAAFTNVGTLSLGAGATLRLRGGSTLGGTVSGAGALVVYGGTALNPSALTVGSFAISGGTTTLGANLAYGGSFRIDNQFATLALNGRTLTLSGATTFATGTIAGAAGLADSLKLTNAASADLSAMGFSSWEAGDSIWITGTTTANTLTGSSQRDRIDGGDGDDVLSGRGGADNLIGGVGIDGVSYATSSAAVKVDLTAGTGTGGDAQGDTFATIEDIVGSDQADTLIGTTGVNRIDGGLGDDRISARAGADILIGGGGIDTVTFGASATGVKVDLTAGVGTGGDAQGDTYATIEDVVGSNSADTLLGGAGANRLDGGLGNDAVAGRGGADELIGGGGTDTLSFGTSVLAVTVNLTTGIGTGGDAEGDTYSGFENINGSNNGDTLIGNGVANRLAAGLGMDTMTGGAAADTFVFNTALGATNIDTITDLTIGSDLVELSKSIFAALQGGATPGSLAPSAFRLSTQASTSGGLGEVIYNAATGSLAYDSDGAGAAVAKQFAQVSTGLALSAASFRLA